MFFLLSGRKKNVDENTHKIAKTNTIASEKLCNSIKFWHTNCVAKLIDLFW